MKKENTTNKANEEVKIENKAEVKVTEKYVRNVIASGIRADIKEKVEATPEVEFDTVSSLVKDASYYIGIRYAGKSSVLMKIWPHGDFVDVTLSKSRMERFAELRPEVIKTVEVKEGNADTSLEVSNKNPEELRKLAVSLVLEVMDALKGEIVEKEKEKAEKQAAKKAAKANAEKKEGTGDTKKKKSSTKKEKIQA